MYLIISYINQKGKKTIRIIAEVAVLAFLLVLCILPFTTAGLHLKVYFEQGEGECVLYYTTKEDFIFDDTKTYRTVIKAMDPAMQKAVVLTQGDPYVVFSEGRVAEFNKAFSHYTVTKVFIVLFIAATYIFAVKKSKRRE